MPCDTNRLFGTHIFCCSTMNSRKRLRWVLPPSLLGLLVGVHYHYTWRNQKPYFDQNVVRKLDAAQSSLYTPYDNTTSCTLPDWTRHLVDVWEPFDLETSSDTPFLWTIPQAGGDTIMSIFSSCLGLTLANHQGKDTHNQVSITKRHHCPTAALARAHDLYPRVVRLCLFPNMVKRLPLYTHQGL